jgi:hypothetical protein
LRDRIVSAYDESELNQELQAFRGQPGFEFTYQNDSPYSSRLLLLLKAVERQGRLFELVQVLVKNRPHKAEFRTFCTIFAPKGYSPEEEHSGNQSVVMVRVLSVRRRQFNLLAWLFPRRDTDPPLWRETTVSLKKLPATLEEIRQAAATQLAKRGMRVLIDNVPFEFVLPADLISLDVDQWHFGPEDVPCGFLNPVVVRRLETAGNKAVQTYVDTRFSHMASTTAVVDDLAQVGEAAATLFLAQPEVSDEFTQKLRITYQVPCALLGFSYCNSDRSKPPSALDSILKAGVPVAVWFRSGLGTNPAQVRAVLVRLHDAGPAGLPLFVRDFRRGTSGPDTEARNHITLLYEDPSRWCPDAMPATIIPGRQT